LRLVVKPGVLLRGRLELFEIGVFTSAFDQQMDVVGHEAVGNDCEQVTVGGAQKLPANEMHSGGVPKRVMAVKGAERQEISMRTVVVERWKVARVVGAHAPEGATAMPRVRLKPDTTTAGLAKARHTTAGLAEARRHDEAG